MSSNSSSKQVGVHLRSGVAAIGKIAAYSSWTVGSVFIVGSLIAGALFSAASHYFGIKDIQLNTTITQVVLSVLVYLIGLGVLLIEPYGVRRMTVDAMKRMLGILRRPQLRDGAYALFAIAAYMMLSVLLSVGATLLIQWLMPGVDMNQEQEIGFESRSGAVDIVLVFLVIVIIAPIVEELVFRGYLYGSLRPRLPWWLCAVIVSILFGIVHGQWNVGVDVFAMSMVACYLREKTDAIWSGVALHMMKNLVAFSVLFLLPEPLSQLLRNL